MKRLIAKIICLFASHRWTCKAALGIPPDTQDIRDGLAGFNRYASMYCARCGRIYEPGN